MSNLKVLIDRAMKRMKITPICHYDGTTMMLRRSSIDGGGIGSPKGTPIRDDQTWKCPTCYHTEHFGIPMTRQDALKEVKLRNGRFLLMPILNPNERHKKDVRERLKQLGYLDFEVLEDE